MRRLVLLLLAGVASLPLGCAASPPPAAAIASAAKPPPAELAASPAAVTAAALAVSAMSASADHDLDEVARRVTETARSRPQAAARRSIVPEAFRVADLPSITIPAPLDAGAAPTTAGGDEATELAVDLGSAKSLGSDYRSARVYLAGKAYGRIRIGMGEAISSPGGSTGMYVNCGGPPSPPRKLLPARWEAVTVTPKGGVEYRITNGWFDTITCKARVMERAGVSAAPLAGRLLYGFRQSGSFQPSPGADRPEGVTILGPRFAHLTSAAVGVEATSSQGAFTRVTFPLRKGAGGSMVGRVDANEVHAWSESLGVELPIADTVTGVELAQGVEDPEPVALAYITEALPDPFLAKK